MSGGAPLLAVEDLSVRFRTEDGVVQAVDGVSFTVGAGEVVAIVGESGSGKSVTSMTLMGLTRSPNASFGGTARFEGVDLISASNDQLRRIRGARIAMVFQDPMSSLDPVQRIGKQIAEQILVPATSVHKVDDAVDLRTAAAFGVADEGCRSAVPRGYVDLPLDHSWASRFKVEGGADWPP